MKVSFSRSRTSTAGKISAELEQKRFDHDDSTSLCHSKILTAMKRWIPFVFRSSARISTRSFRCQTIFNGRRFLSRLLYLLTCSLTIFGSAGRFISKIKLFRRLVDQRIMPKAE